MEQVGYRDEVNVRERKRGKGCRRGNSEELGALLFLELVRVNALGVGGEG